MCGIVYFVYDAKHQDEPVSEFNSPKPFNPHTAIEWEDNEEINIFRQYLRIPTVHPNVNYGKAINDRFQIPIKS